MTKETNQNDNPVEDQIKNKKRENKRKEQSGRKPKRRVNENAEKSTAKLPNAKSTRRIGAKRKQEVKPDSEYDFGFKKGKLKIIPLGGLEEIGKNITVFEYEDEMILVDCGLEFPEDNMLGVDMVIPDVTYLERNKEKLKGLVITHGHEDHIGSIPYVLKKVDMPIYATKLACGLIKNKLEEHKMVRRTKLIEVEQGETINFGKIKVEFIRSFSQYTGFSNACNKNTSRNSTSHRRL